jgi:hypothetical protein
MSDDVTERIFDPSDELEHLGEREDFGLSTETIFRLCWFCKSAAGFNATTTVFITKQRFGCVVSFALRRAAFELELRRTDASTFLSLHAQLADSASPGERAGEWRDTPEAWELILRKVARIEGVNLLTTNLADNLRTDWDDYVRAQRRLRDERGF